jgi:hypothetical protein
MPCRSVTTVRWAAMHRATATLYQERWLLLMDPTFPHPLPNDPEADLCLPGDRADMLIPGED